MCKASRNKRSCQGNNSMFGCRVANMFYHFGYWSQTSHWGNVDYSTSITSLSKKNIHYFLRLKLLKSIITCHSIYYLCISNTHQFQKAVRKLSGYKVLLTFTYLWNSHFLNCLKCSKSNSKEHNINACFPAKSRINSSIIDQNGNFVTKKCLGMFPKNCPILFLCYITPRRKSRKK